MAQLLQRGVLDELVLFHFRLSPGHINRLLQLCAGYGPQCRLKWDPSCGPGPNDPGSDPVQGPSCINDPVQGPTSTNDLVQGPSSTNDPVQGPSSTNDPVQGPSSTHDLLQGPSPTHDLVQGPSSTSDPVQGPISTNDPIKSPSFTNDPVQGPCSTNDPVRGPSSTNDPVHNPNSTNDPEQGPSSTNNPVQGPISTNDLVQGPSSTNDLIQEPSSSTDSSQIQTNSDPEHGSGSLNAEHVNRGDQTEHVNRGEQPQQEVGSIPQGRSLREAANQALLSAIAQNTLSDIERTSESALHDMSDYSDLEIDTDTDFLFDTAILNPSMTESPLPWGSAVECLSPLPRGRTRALESLGIITSPHCSQLINILVDVLPRWQHLQRLALYSACECIRRWIINLLLGSWHTNVLYQ